MINDPPKRVAVVGGEAYVIDQLDAFLTGLAAKYPNVTVVTGNGRGVEGHVRDEAALYGLDIDVPVVRPDLYGKAALEIQITEILMGADVIVVAGNPDSSRGKVAITWHKRCYPPYVKVDRVPLHIVANPVAKKPKAPPKRARSKRQRNAVSTA